MTPNVTGAAYRMESNSRLEGQRDRAGLTLWLIRAATMVDRRTVSADFWLRHPSARGTASTFQMVLAYWPMVRSDENWPMPATLRMDFRTQAAGSQCRAPTCSWQAM